MNPVFYALVVKDRAFAAGAACTGCGKCVEACPFGLIVKDEAAPYSSKCTACGICVKACPMELLEIVEK